MIIDEIIDFLEKVPPFQFLNEAELKSIAMDISMEFYEKGATILYQDGPASEYLHVIKKGEVKVFITSNEGEDILIDYRSEGDSFGFLSLVSGDRSRANVVAAEDTICYLVKKNSVFKLLDSNPAFSEFFLKSFLNKYIDKTFKEMHNKSLLYGGGDKLLFTTPIGEIASKEVITASQEISIKEAANLMCQNKISSLVLVDSDDVPTGIVTDRDLRDKVVSKGRSVDDRISSIMSVSLIKAEVRDYCFEALLKMIRYNIHHLLVVDEGRLKGIITNHDLMMLQGTSPISIAREIDSQQTIDGLVPVSRKINKIVGLLLKEGAKASNITKIITEINDRLIKRILEIAERKLGTPPVNYCWIVYGSEGRKEQTFKTDQDNAIIYEDPKTKNEELSAKEYFEKFSVFTRDALVKCGFSLCTGDYMASNPRWRQPLETWEGYFSDWINTPTTEAILFSVILFDFRPVFGDFSLADKLRTHLFESLKNHDMFLVQMAKMTVNVRPPLSFFKTFVVEKSGEHKDKLNLKFRCIAPLLNLIRLYSLEKRITETSSLERLARLKDIHDTVKEFGEEIEHAFEFVMLLRIHHQFAQIEEGKEPDNFIDPDNLSTLEKKTLKEVSRLISRLQDIIAAHYMLGRIM